MWLVLLFTISLLWIDAYKHGNSTNLSSFCLLPPLFFSWRFWDSCLVCWGCLGNFYASHYSCLPPTNTRFYLLTTFPLSQCDLFAFQTKWVEVQMTFLIMSFETQIHHWVSDDIFENVIWVSTTPFESQLHHLSFRWHFQKCHLSLNYTIWVSNDIFKNVFWTSNAAFEPQMTFQKLFF